MNTARSVFLLCVCIAVVYAEHRIRYADVPLERDETWEVLNRYPADSEVTVRFALRQRNLAALEEAFFKVSDPKDSQFHQYWTKEEVIKLVSPPEQEQHVVVAWAHESGCSHAQSFGDYVEVTCSSETLEQMLGDVEISEVRDVLLGQTTPKIISGQYSLPANIARVVDFVQNIAMNVHKKKLGSYRPDVRPDREQRQRGPRYEPPSEDQVIPATLYNLYNISYTISTDSSQCVAEFTNFGYLDSDLQAYDTGCGVQSANPFTAVGSYSPSPPDTECTLDVQMITSVGLNGTNFYYTIDGWVLDFAQALLQSNDPPMVNSISWSADERTEGYQYNSRSDAEFQKLGLIGVSILAASGDDGAVGASRCSGNRFYFNPGYPATSPYVTSVGATMLIGKPQTSTSVAPVCSEPGHVCAVNGQEVSDVFFQLFLCFF